jgi:hypothetical protein
VTCLWSKVLMQLGTSVLSVLDVPHALLVVNTFTTSIAFPPPRCASIMPWMYKTGVGASLAQYFDAATGAMALKRFSPFAEDLCDHLRSRAVPGGKHTPGVDAVVGENVIEHALHLGDVGVVEPGVVGTLGKYAHEIGLEARAFGQILQLCVGISSRMQAE